MGAALWWAPLASLSAGKWVTAERRRVEDRDFGLQFRAGMLNRTDNQRSKR